MPSEEIFDVTDEHDNVIGQAPRSEVHARGLLHRAVHIFVFNTAGQLLLQMRCRDPNLAQDRPQTPVSLRLPSSSISR